MTNPIEDYLNGLVWDRTPRIDGWLFYYLGASVDFMQLCQRRRLGPKFLIQMVARGIDPGCRADNVLVLEGAQASGKTRALETLAHPWHWVGGLGDLSLRKMEGKWLIEINDNDIASLRDSSLIPLFKGFISQSVDLYRDENQKVQYRHRQCVFVGTTNVPAPVGFTGCRRFWVVKTGAILLDELAGDRDQLFAEAVQRYRNGEPWWLE